MFMHSFIRAYSDEELAALANTTTSQFGHCPGKITPGQIRKLRTSEPD
jgi:hypothetical protein